MPDNHDLGVGPVSDGPAPTTPPAVTISATDLTERPEDTVRRYARRLGAIEELHEPRQRTVEGHTLRWCRECGQDWPCPTMGAATNDD